jgi:hypothetical protein
MFSFTGELHGQTLIGKQGWVEQNRTAFLGIDTGHIDLSTGMGYSRRYGN